MTMPPAGIAQNDACALQRVKQQGDYSGDLSTAVEPGASHICTAAAPARASLCTSAC